METYKVEDVDMGVHRRLQLTPSDEEPTFIVSTEFADVGIVTKWNTTNDLILAINAVYQCLACTVIAAKRYR